MSNTNGEHECKQTFGTRKSKINKLVNDQPTNILRSKTLWGPLFPCFDGVTYDLSDVVAKERTTLEFGE